MSEVTKSPLLSMDKLNIVTTTDVVNLYHHLLSLYPWNDARCPVTLKRFVEEKRYDKEISRPLTDFEIRKAMEAIPDYCKPGTTAKAPPPVSRVSIKSTPPPESQPPVKSPPVNRIPVRQNTAGDEIHLTLVRELIKELTEIQRSGLTSRTNVVVGNFVSVAAEMQTELIRTVLEILMNAGWDGTQFTSEPQILEIIQNLSLCL